MTSSAGRFPAGRSRGVTVAVDGVFAYVGRVRSRPGGGLATAVAPSTITGPGAGLSLFGFGLATLLAGRLTRRGRAGAG